VISGRNAERAEKVVIELQNTGAAASFVQTDVSDVTAAQASVAATIQRHGRIDCLVNAAGLTTRGSLLDTSPELFDQHIAVNLRAPFFLMQAAIADMKRRAEPGTIVNVISIDSHGGQSFLAPYVAAKAGLAGLTKNAAHAHRWDRIRINGLNMGWSATDGEDQTQRRAAQTGDLRAQGGSGDWQTAAGATLPMGKLGQPDEIADFITFLLSDRSGVVTGSVIDWDQIIIGGLG
jgi:NAD(P)-dependent dehydrogenase (short-subunit alcohol dehydrogenase family)